MNVVVVSILIAASASSPGTDRPAPWQPVTERFESGIALATAVEYTLRNDPGIRLQESAMRQAEGVWIERRGAFDPTLDGNGGYQYRQQELTETAKEGQRDQRRQLEVGIENLAQADAGAKNLIADLRALRDGAPTSTIDGDDSASRNAQTQLEFIDRLIANEQDPGAAQRLLEIRSAVIDKFLELFEPQAAQIAQGLEDARRIRRQLGDSPNEEVIQDANGVLRLAKQFRMGLVVTPFIDGLWSSNNFKGKERDPEFGGKGIAPHFEFSVGFEVHLPLLRGLGRSSTAAAERAAELDWEAAVLSRKHRIARSVLDTTLDYWAARAAADRIEVAQESVRLQSELSGLTTDLIGAGELPRVEEARARASLADSEARLAEAQRALHEARVNLARSMGVALADAATAPLASEALPGRAAAHAWSDEQVGALVAAGLALRFDAQASELALRSAGVFLDKARSDLKPILDLDGKTFFKSLGDAPFDRVVDKWAYPNFSLGLALEAPLGNHAARGRHLQARAGHEQQAIQAAEVRRSIGLNVIRLAASLRSAAERLRLAEDAVLHYDRTVVDERERLKAGDTSLIDSILTEQQTTSARLARIAAAQEYASLLARLRFESGMLVTDTPDGAEVTGANLTTLPPPLTGGGN